MFTTDQSFLPVWGGQKSCRKPILCMSRIWNSQVRKDILYGKIRLAQRIAVEAQSRRGGQAGFVCFLAICGGEVSGGTWEQTKELARS